MGQLQQKLWIWTQTGDLPADLDRWARLAWWAFRHEGRPEFEPFARALYAAPRTFARVPRPKLGPPRSLMDEAFVYGDEVSLRPEPLAGQHVLDAIAASWRSKPTSTRR
jgi:hypothetical protein